MMWNRDHQQTVPLPFHRWLKNSVRELLGRSRHTGEVLLGEEHPLVRALDLVGVVTRQSLVVKPMRLDVMGRVSRDRVTVAAHLSSRREAPRRC
jgi:hypothetical protein